jgi:hypothetical protein
MNDYEAKKQARIDRLREAADKADRRSGDAIQASRAATEGIPFGQPILVGHHSEKRHRNALKRSDNAMRRACEEMNKAKDLRYRANAAEMNTSISSDDPEALAKLREKLEGLEAKRDKIKAANRKVTNPPLKNYRAETIEVENQFYENETYSVGQVEMTKAEYARKHREYKGTKKVDSSHRVRTVSAGAGQINAVFLTDSKVHEKPEPAGPSTEKLPGYCLSNLGANIRSVKERIEEMEQEPPEPAEDVTGPGWKIYEDADENRMVVAFDRRITKEAFKAMRSFGFVWSRTRSEFVRKLTGNARSSRTLVANYLDGREVFETTLTNDSGCRKEGAP